MCHTEAKDRGEDPPALKQNSCGVFNDRRTTKICKKFPKWRKTETEHENEQRANKENRREYRHKEDHMEDVKEPVSTTDMAVELFKAMSQGSGRGIRCLYQVAFSGGMLPKQKPEQHKDSTLTMLQHIEDPEAWEKIYKLVNVLWLKEATYRTVEINMGGKESTMKRERSQRTQAEKPVEFKKCADAHEKRTSFTRSLSK